MEWNTKWKNRLERVCKREGLIPPENTNAKLHHAESKIVEAITKQGDNELLLIFKEVLLRTKVRGYTLLRLALNNGRLCTGCKLGLINQSWVNICPECNKTPEGKEIGKKLKQVTCMKKYGVPNPSQSLEVKNKVDATNYKKYGVRRAMQLPETREKGYATYKERTGFRHSMQNPATIEKLKANSQINWGYDFPSQSDDFKAKAWITRIEKHGGGALALPEFRSKYEATSMANWGVPWASASEGVKELIVESCMDKFGFPNAMMHKAVIAKANSTKYEKFGSGVSYLGNTEDAKRAFERFKDQLKIKTWTYRRRTFKGQGYEIPVYQYLIKEKKVRSGQIKTQFDGFKASFTFASGRWVFPDFCYTNSKGEEIYVDVKSTFTLLQGWKPETLNRNRDTQESMNKLGVNFRFMIYSPNKGVAILPVNWYKWNKDKINIFLEDNYD